MDEDFNTTVENDDEGQKVIIDRQYGTIYLNGQRAFTCASNGEAKNALGVIKAILETPDIKVLVGKGAL